VPDAAAIRALLQPRLDVLNDGLAAAARRDAHRSAPAGTALRRLFRDSLCGMRGHHVRPLMIPSCVSSYRLRQEVRAQAQAHGPLCAAVNVTSTIAAFAPVAAGGCAWGAKQQHLPDCSVC
jgi:hypothetical protein